MPHRPHFDFAAVRDGVRGQYRWFADAVSGLPAEMFARPTRLGDWTVAELVGHLSLGMSSIARYLTGPPAAKAGMDTIDWALACAGAAPDVDERARAMTSESRPAELRAAALEACVAAEAALDIVTARFLVATRFGDLSVTDYLATRCVEGCVHSLDLAAAVGAPPSLDNTAAAVSARLLAATLAHVAPGRAVELRVPPAVAVQFGTGPRHTRGTPGSVVEADPVSWLELATGRLSWQQALAAGRARASGEHADLAGLLPVLS